MTSPATYATANALSTNYSHREVGSHCCDSYASRVAAADAGKIIILIARFCAFHSKHLGDHRAAHEGGARVQESGTQQTMKTL